MKALKYVTFALIKKVGSIRAEGNLSRKFKIIKTVAVLINSSAKCQVDLGNLHSIIVFGTFLC